MGFDAVRIDHCTGPSMNFFKKTYRWSS
jgi:hypothetical protein